MCGSLTATFSFEHLPRYSKNFVLVENAGADMDHIVRILPNYTNVRDFDRHRYPRYVCAKKVC